MNGSAKKFSDVFGKMNLSADVQKNFRHADVYAIHVHKQERLMRIGLQFNADAHIVHEQYTQDFQEQLKVQLPFLQNISVDVKYTCTDMQKIVAQYWNNIVYHVGLTSPICSRMLSGAAWSVDHNELHIPIQNNAVFFFTRQSIGQKIQSLLHDRFDCAIHVTFAEQKTSSDNDEKRARQLAEMVASAVQELPQTSTTAKANVPVAKTTYDYKKNNFGNSKSSRKQIRVNMILSGNVTQLNLPLVEEEEIYINGRIFDVEQRVTKNKRLLVTFLMSDGHDSVTVKFFLTTETFEDKFKELVQTGAYIAVKGKVQYDSFAEELNVMAFEICAGIPPAIRMDNAKEKRVELHLHTQMSSMDGINSATDFVKRAALWGHTAIGLTDHGVVQAFPEAMEAAKKKNIKVLYGVEAYLVDDLGAVVQCPRGQTLTDDFVVFDLETTGLSKEQDTIIEIGAVRVQNGVVTDVFSTLVNPQRSLPSKIVELTHITDEMLQDQPLLPDVMPLFLAFVQDAVLVAHNASFDVGFVEVAAQSLGRCVDNTVLDTVELSRTLFPQLHKHKLDVVAQHLGITLANHHRAVDDAQATAAIFIQCIHMLHEKNIHTLEQINILASEAIDKKKLKTYHAIIYARNQAGLRNLYELISKAHIDYFYKKPRIPKSTYLQLKDGLMIGTACEAGEFYKAVRDNKPADYIRSLAEFYDYFEIQPVENNMYLLRNGVVASVQALLDINMKIVELGAVYNKPVVATCDVHFMEPEDEVYRRIIMHGLGFKDADNQAPLFYRTTEEMLEAFAYLGAEKAKEVVITNTNKIADMIEPIKPIPDETFTPKIEGAEEELRHIATARTKALYGESLPPIIADRLDRELQSIVKHGFSVMYIIAQKLVWRSMEDGYLVGSRGSVGSSFVASMAGITEVNPLPPHYLCPNCQYVDFTSEVVQQFSGGSGVDMPDAVCPSCGTALCKDGHDIPFETFLGFDGDKEPDIDLNFSGEYQARAHAYTEELFGTGYVFKAGTIGTIAEKTAYMYVKKYLEETEKPVRNAEITRLRIGCTGIKRTTGQHPGGLVVVPSDKSIYEFSPVQRPANDTKSTVVTTHFDYHSISGRLLKLDILGHDVPTIVRMLQDITGVDPTTVDLGDKKVLSLFTSPAALGVRAEDILCKTGTLGLPEFGTSFVRNMLLETQPSSFAELVRISGLSHGTDVWFNNAQTLIHDGIATLKEIIPCRDDIMVYLIHMGVEKQAAFKIMENVRKGFGLKPMEEEILVAANVPTWYIESCKRIKYLFPKGHAVAYVMMTMRIGYYKIYYPYSFYAASFSVKAEDFDYVLMCNGPQIVRENMERLAALGKDANAKEKSLLALLELVLEMYVRGLKFVPLHLYTADAFKFTVTADGLMPPLCAIQGLGTNVAQNIAEARKEGDFITIEDFKARTKTNKTVIELLKANRILSGIPDTMQMSLF